MEYTSNMETPRRLYKSRRNKMIDGICGGVAEYFDLDPTIVRVVWVLFTLLGGAGIILYIAAMIIMPTNPEPYAVPPPATHVRNANESRRFWGIVLILIGALILMANLGWFAFFDWFHMSWEILFPIMLILIGLWFIYIYTRKPMLQPAAPGPQGPTGSETWTTTAGGTVAADANQGPVYGMPKELRRSITDRKLFGVCGGIAKYFQVDPTIVRVAYIMLVVASVGWGLLLYIILAFLVPEEKVTDL